MLAYITGKLVEKRPTDAVIDAHGIGFRVLIPTSTYESLPAIGEKANLLIHFHVREDAIMLFGFGTRAERSLFEMMIGVTGIGPKLALAALSAMSPAELRDNVLSGNTALLTHIPGVGRKTAERLIIELRDRISALEEVERAAAPLSGGTETRAAARADALAALEQLGLSRAAAEKNIRKVLRDHPAIQSADELVRLALRES